MTRRVARRGEFFVCRLRKKDIRRDISVLFREYPERKVFPERMMTMVKICELFDLSRSLAGEYLAGFAFPWQALSGIGEMVLELTHQLGCDYSQIDRDVWAHGTAEVASTAALVGPCIIGPETVIRPGAYIRGNVLVGQGCVIGNSTELKNAILFDGVQVPHYNYVGDSILGYKSHMGAGSITSNVKSDKTLIAVKNGNEKIETGLKKFGAMLGDFVEIGCGTVLNPGSVIGRNTNIYPLSCVRGCVPENSIYKTGGIIVAKGE